MVDQVELVERLRAIDSEAEAWLAIEEAADTIERLAEAAKPFADSIVIDPNKQRGERHWSTFGRQTDIDDVLRLKAVLAKIGVPHPNNTGEV